LRRDGPAVDRAGKPPGSGETPARRSIRSSLAPPSPQARESPQPRKEPSRPGQPTGLGFAATVAQRPPDPGHPGEAWSAPGGAAVEGRVEGEETVQLRQRQA